MFVEEAGVLAVGFSCIAIAVRVTIVERDRRGGSSNGWNRLEFPIQGAVLKSIAGTGVDGSHHF